jgi:hypothetical protein
MPAASAPMHRVIAGGDRPRSGRLPVASAAALAPTSDWGTAGSRVPSFPAREGLPKTRREKIGEEFIGSSLRHHHGFTRQSYGNPGPHLK